MGDNGIGHQIMKIMYLFIYPYIMQEYPGHFFLYHVRIWTGAVNLQNGIKSNKGRSICAHVPYSKSSEAMS